MDLLDLMLPEHLHGVVHLKDFLHMTDEQWAEFLDAPPEVQLIYRAKCRPQNDEELDAYCKFVLGISFPKTCHPTCAHKEVPCNPPFKVLRDMFFAEYPLIILKASRGSGKSVLLATCCLIEQICLDAEVLVIGGSEEQAKVVFNYINPNKSRFADKFWNSPFMPKLLRNKQYEQQTYSQIVSGGVIKCLPASETAVLGQRPSRLRIDEADKAKIDLIESALPCCHPSTDKTVDNQTVLSSTHYDPNGTLSYYINHANRANKAAGRVVIPVYSFCYRDALEENGGYLTPKLLEGLKLGVNKITWERQFENGEPAVENPLFTDEDLEFMFDEEYGIFETDDSLSYQEWNINPDILDQENNPEDYLGYYVGCDFGDKIDWTVISQFIVPEDESKPDVMTKWIRVGRCGSTICARYYNQVLVDTEQSSAHDATGQTRFVSEVLTEYSEPVSFTKQWKHEALNSWISAVEQHKFKMPKIKSLQAVIRNLTFDQCFSSTIHLPDEVASLILAWWARRRVMKNLNIGTMKF